MSFYTTPRSPHPTGLLGQAQIVSLPDGVSTVAHESDSVTATLSSQDGQVNPVRKQIETIHCETIFAASDWVVLTL